MLYLPGIQQRMANQNISVYSDGQYREDGDGIQAILEQGIDTAHYYPVDPVPLGEGHCGQWQYQDAEQNISDVKVDDEYCCCIP